MFESWGGRRRRNVALSAVLAAPLVACGANSGAQHPASPDARPEGTTSPTEESPAGRALPIPSDLVAEVEQARALGSRLFVLDSSTAVAWDALEAELGPLQQAGLGHFLAVLGGDQEGNFDGTVHVLFFTAESPPRQAYDVVVSTDPQGIHINPTEPPDEADSTQQAVLRARQTALHAVQSNQALNPVVVPGPAGSIVVYLLAATTRPDIAVLGRHFRVTVSAGGDRIISVTPLSNSALELPTRGPAGERPVALTVTHVVSDAPLETHVFTSRLIQLPIYVGTRRGLWLVDGYDISYRGPLQ